MVRIGIDVRSAGGASGRRGVGAYVRGLLAGIASRIDAAGDEVLLFGTGAEGPLPVSGNFRRVRLARPRRAITFFDQIAWPPLLARRGVSVFHSPFYAIPRLRPRGCRVVQTVHDLTPLKLPGAVSRRNERLFRANFALAKSADRIIVPSDATRTDVVSMLGVDAARVIVIPMATDITAQEAAAAGARVTIVREKLGIPPDCRYLLHTGGHDIVKNLPRLLDAFARLVRQGRDLHLVIAGEHGEQTPAAIGRAAMLGILDRVKLPGHLPREDLIALYRGAAALVYPSYTEGFGLPVVEAMTCGTPVVASRAASLPEVGGAACLYADPADAESIGEAVASILDDPELAGRLGRDGAERAARFSWSETARRTLQVYREAAA